MRTDQETGLHRSLRQRHMTMISLGGMLGEMAVANPAVGSFIE
jgi:amino acid permease